MSINISTRTRRGVSLLFTALFIVANTSAIFARPPAGSTSAQHGDHRHGADDRDARQAAGPRHGGRVTTTATYAFEVVYQRDETRVYLYDRSMRPASARGLRGEVVMQVRGNSNLYRYRLDYATVDPRSAEQDYLVARIDVSQVRDGDMQVTFDLAGLPARNEPAARFTQTFALTRTAPVVTVPVVTVAAVTRDDSAAIARQGNCVVMDTKLGDHGTPLKLTAGRQSLFVCCRGCVGKVKKNPSLYFRTASR